MTEEPKKLAPSDAPRWTCPAQPQTFDGEAGTYSDWRCATCKPEPMKVLTPMERSALFYDIAVGNSDIVYAREEPNGFVYLTVKKRKPLLTDIIMERLK